MCSPPTPYHPVLRTPLLLAGGDIEGGGNYELVNCRAIKIPNPMIAAMITITIKIDKMI